MGPLVLAAIAVTAALITLLCLRDPKRQRAYGVQGGTYSSAVRWALIAGALLPGVAYALAADAAAFFLWFGGSAVAGWGIALLFSGWKQRS